MPVQNFLEDEEYESQNIDSAVPDFLQDEEYEHTGGDEYYGGGFADGNSEGGVSGSLEDGFFGSYGDEDDLEETGDEELFEGGELFGADAEDGEPGAESSSYGISGITLPGARPVVTPVDTVSSPVATTAPSTTIPTATSGSGAPVDGSTTGATPSEGSGSGLNSSGSGSVPNFLEDEDEDDSGATAPVPASSQEASSAPARPRRDLSKRSVPGRTAPSEPSATPSGGTTPITSSPSTTPSSGPVSTPRIATPTTSAPSSTPKPRTEAIPGAPLSASEAVRFDPRAAVEPVDELEAAALKAPSSYASKRDPKFTALKQSDSTVRKVGSDGLTPAERARASSAAATTKLRTPRTGKLSEEEILFYANLGARRVGDYGSATKKQLFLPPALAETPEQKVEREARINRALAGGSVARGTRSRLTEKDYRVLRFIALFKFSSERQIAKLLQVGEHSAYKRLNELRKHGLTKGFKTLGVKGSVWMLTDTGMDLSGFDLPRGTESALTLSMVSHQFTVNHVAAHLWSGGANVLREKSFPQRNLPDGSGGFGFGEQLISELQIQSAFGKVRGSSKADAYVPQIKKHMANQFDSWQRAGGVEFGPSPELQRGNEYMWTLFPPISNRLNYHVPDLVVARPRSADGKPQSIAVEVELKTKADDTSYEKTLDAYRSDDSIYRKVVWVCRLKGTAEKLTRIAKRNGLADQGRIAIVPIYLEDGSRFTGKDTWSL